MQQNTKKIWSIITIFVLSGVMLSFVVGSAMIIKRDQTISLQMFQLFKSLFPIILFMFVSLSFLIRRTDTFEQFILPSEPLFISDADRFLYDLPPDEPYLNYERYKVASPAGTNNQKITTELLHESETAKRTVPYTEQKTEEVSSNLGLSQDEMAFFKEIPIPTTTVNDPNDIPHAFEDPTRTDGEQQYKTSQSSSEKNRIIPDADSRNTHAVPKDFEEASIVTPKGRLFRIVKDMTQKDEESSAASEETTQPEIEDTFDNRLMQETVYANQQDYELSVFILRLRFPKQSKTPVRTIYDQAIREFLGSSTYVYQDEENQNKYYGILPFYSFHETQMELSALYRYLRESLEEDECILSIGFSSRFSREDIIPETLIKEAQSSMKKALRRKSFSLLGFEPDPNRFETFL